jgi:NTP pyrophosphatase (non-canonical NTP hydrolase)
MYSYMDRFINKGSEAYRPFAPRQPGIFSNAAEVTSVVERDGLFYLAAERSHGEVNTLTDYQEWCEAGWKQQHGTYAAASRFIDKLVEEVGEMKGAREAFRDAGKDRDGAEAVELLSELGDVLWCTTALASNSSADIDAGLKMRLADYTDGVNDYSAGIGAQPASWRMDAALAAHAFSDLSFDAITDLVRKRFEPLATPVMNIYDDEPQFSITGHIELVMMNAYGMKGLVDQQYGYGEADRAYVMLHLYDTKATDIATMAAEVYLNVAYIAHYELGLTLSDVVKKNIEKIERRIQAGRVDKSDGTRDTQLL